MSDRYQETGFGTGRIGWGDKPGIAVVDFQTAFTDPKYPLGKSPMVHAAVDRTAELLKAARAANVPVANCYTATSSARDALRWKIPTVVNEFHHGHPCTELDPRIFDRDYDAVVCKKGPSLFFETNAVSIFIKERVDTVVVVGCNTSGCIRATVNDAFSYGFRVMIPVECVGDVEEGPHEDNLRDVGRRYADVVTLAETLEAIEAYRGRNAH